MSHYSYLLEVRLIRSCFWSEIVVEENFFLCRKSKRSHSGRSRRRSLFFHETKTGTLDDVSFSAKSVRIGDLYDVLQQNNMCNDCLLEYCVV